MASINMVLIGQVGGVFLLVALGLSYRFQWIAFNVFSILFGLILCAGLLLAILSLFQWGWEYYHDDGSVSTSGHVNVAIAAVLILFVLTIVYRFQSVPPIHDISTDIDNPPSFIKAEEHRPAHYNTLEYQPKVGQQQRQAYPRVKPLYLSQPVDKVFSIMLERVNTLQWQTTYIDPQQKLLEATDTSRLLGFVDDIVIRVSEDKGQSRVDVRSVSRLGLSDLGANAKRIQRLLDMP